MALQAHLVETHRERAGPILDQLEQYRRTRRVFRARDFDLIGGRKRPASLLRAELAPRLVGPLVSYLDFVVSFKLARAIHENTQNGANKDLFTASCCFVDRLPGKPDLSN